MTILLQYHIKKTLLVFQNILHVSMKLSLQMKQKLPWSYKVIPQSVTEALHLSGSHD